MSSGKIGVIGGSGLYAMPDLEQITEVQVDTPFGAPSDAYVLGTLHGRELVFLPRHGRGHRIPPSAMNFRANIYGLKALGVEWVISISAVGSMREDIKPGDLIVPSQFFDRTRTRISTFFDQDVVAHVAFADPICNALAQAIYQAATQTDATVHAGGTYLCIEGPQFSTRAESQIYRQWGIDIIGMTNLPEARLAREAELCYATLALATDYDCWHESASDVDIESILAVLQRNVQRAQEIIGRTVADLPASRPCACSTALQSALITEPATISLAARARLGLLIDHYLP
jgi:5'-methylthioadenosine phosphorylase